MRNRLFVVFAVLLLVSLSCSLSSQPELSEADTVATWVAETLASGEMPVMDTPAPLLETQPETGDLEPTNTPVSEATPVIPPSQAVETEAPMLIDNPPPAGFDASLLRVAYFSNNQLKLWTEGAGETVLYNGEPVADILLSEDGWVIVFTTRDADFVFTGLWRVNADGSDLRRLLDGGSMDAFATNPSAEGVSPYQMEFVPGTRMLAFNTRLVFMGPGLIIQDDLRLLDTSSGSLSTLVEAGQGGAFTYSPDGSQIALVSPTSVSLVNADGSNRRSNVITFPMIMTYSEYQFYPMVSWEADSSAIWVVIPSEDSLAPDASMAVWKIAAADGTPNLAATYPFDLSLFFAGHVLSPDMQQIAYLQREGAPEANQWALHVARLGSSADRVLRTGSIRFKSWSPGGNWVTIEEDGEFLIGDINGSFRPMADVLPAIEVQWVDSERFLFLSGDYEAMQLHLGSLSAPSLSIGEVTNNYIPFSFSVGGS